MGQTVCPIYDENSQFIGLWALSPEFQVSKGSMSEMGNLAESTIQVLNSHPLRRVENHHVEVGNGVRFDGGIFVMLEGNLAPSEELVKPDSETAYLLLNYKGIACLKRCDRSDPGITSQPPRSEDEVTNESMQIEVSESNSEPTEIEPDPIDVIPLEDAGSFGEFKLNSEQEGFVNYILARDDDYSDYYSLLDSNSIYSLLNRIIFEDGKTLPDTFTETALKDAINEGEMLAENGGNLDQQTGYYTAMQTAIKCNDFMVFQILIVCGADPCHWCSNGSSPVFDLVGSHPIDVPMKDNMLRFLLERNAVDWDTPVRTPVDPVYTLRDWANQQGVSLDLASYG